MQKYTINTNLPKNLPLLLRQRMNEDRNGYFQAAKNPEGLYEKFTFTEVYEKVIIFALGLRKLGIHRGSNVAMISENRKEWFITDMAIQSLGGADVPRGCDSMGTEIRFIISFAECEFAFFENYKQLEKVLEKREEVPELKTVVLFDEMSREQEQEFAEKAPDMEFRYYEEIFAVGQLEYNLDKEGCTAEIEAEMNKTEEDDVCTIIFTSGTTGTPKGVMLTHKNYLSQLSVVHNFMPGKKGTWWLSILPVWHSFERLAQYVALYLGVGLAYSKPNAKVLLADMSAIEPRYLCGVPRLWEALAQGVERTMKKTGGITYKLYKFFIAVGKNYADFRDMVRFNVLQDKKRSKVLDCMAGLIPFIALWPLHKLGDVLVFRKIRAKFGKNFAFAISGGGALQDDTNNFFRAVGMNMVNGYGMTETAPAIAFSNPFMPVSGCIGKILPSIEAKIVREEHGQILSSEPLPFGQKGMILIRGPHVMKGYYKRPDLTEKIIDKDGWLNTGDVGMFTFDNDLKITGRAKDTIVLLDGENIEPVGIENAMCSSEFIESAVVIGQDRKYLASLIVPAREAVLNFAKEQKLRFQSYEELLEMDVIRKLIQSQIAKLISSEKGFRLCEKISKFELISASFKVGEELSAKQEIMRHKIVEKYHALIEKLYA